MTGLPPQERSWDDLLGTDRAAPGELVQDVQRQLGPDPLPSRRERPDGLPDVTGLAEGLGL
jgi:hypothetical protein